MKTPYMKTCMYFANTKEYNQKRKQDLETNIK